MVVARSVRKDNWRFMYTFSKIRRKKCALEHRVFESISIFHFFIYHPAKQWRSQDIAVARAQHGHTSILRLYELPREVQKLIGGSEGIPPPRKFRNFTTSPETIYRSKVYGKLMSV